MKINLPKFNNKNVVIVVLTVAVLIASLTAGVFAYKNRWLTGQNIANVEALGKVQNELTELKNQDQIKVNQDLKAEIAEIKTSFSKAIPIYERLTDLRQTTKVADLDALFAQVLAALAKEDYQKANQLAADLDSKIAAKTIAIQPTTAPQQATAPVSNTPPDSGYSRQKVTTDAGDFTVDIVSADLATTKVIVDTASTQDCSDNCPRFPLTTYISRNGAYAGVNGAYYCPVDYPSCAGKVNSFDLLIMNKDKYYFNSDNNVYSVNPGVIFGGSYVRFITAVSQWGRDTSIDSMLSNFPLLVFNSQIYFTGNNDAKMTIKSSRSFVANKGNKVFIGVVFSATVAESAKALHALGMENALNLDGGGSTALWANGGYKAGPGRDLTNVILFLRR